MKVISILLAISLFVSGCGMVMKQSDVVTFDRQQAIKTWDRVKFIYWKVTVIASIACQSGRWSQEQCEEALKLHREAKEIGAEIDTKLSSPEYEVDWNKVLRILEIIVDILV